MFHLFKCRWYTLSPSLILHSIRYFDSEFNQLALPGKGKVAENEKEKKEENKEEKMEER